mgnify:CR=1 FL=1
MRIEVSQLPPATSSPNSRAGWRERHKEAKVYHDAVFYCCVDARNRAWIVGADAVAFPFVKARLDLTFVFPEYRRRDLDNTLSRAKPCLDAIVHSGLLLDDDAEHLEIGKVEIVVDPQRAPLTVIELQEDS